MSPSNLSNLKEQTETASCIRQTHVKASRVLPGPDVNVLQFLWFAEPESGLAR